jgi:IS1 family transposase
MTVVLELRLWIVFAYERVDDEFYHWNFGSKNGIAGSYPAKSA